MVKIINFLKQMYTDYEKAQKELNSMGFYIVPAGYTYAVMYLNPELSSSIKSTDQKDFENNSQ